MSVDKATVARIAHLSRIKLAKRDLEAMTGELNAILGFIEQLSEVNTDHVPPMTFVEDMALPQRQDEITDGDRRQEVLANAPAAEHGFFAVPKVIE